jgi:hypothetical protein
MQHHGEREQHDRPGRRPAVLAGLHDRVDERHQPGRDRDGAGDVEAAVRLLVPGFRQVAQRQHEHGHADRDVDEEDPGPGEKLGQGAADDEANRAAADGDCGPDTKRLARSAPSWKVVAMMASAAGE